MHGTFDGFVSERLLKPTEDEENYFAIVAHGSGKTFMTMRRSEARQKAWAEMEPLLDGSPMPRFYEVIIASEKGKKR